MTKRELLRRIEALEQRVASLESRPNYGWYPYALPSSPTIALISPREWTTVSAIKGRLDTNVGRRC